MSLNTVSPCDNQHLQKRVGNFDPFFIQNKISQTCIRENLCKDKVGRPSDSKFSLIIQNSYRIIISGAMF
jgi:hypothetical protein